MNENITNKKYGYKHFYFFQRITPDLLLELGRRNPIAENVYLLLMHCSSNIGCCEVSQPDIARFIGKSVRTVARAINFLAVHYYIAVAHSGRANIYVLNFNQVWGTYNYKKSAIMKHVTFPTNTVIKRNKRNRSFFRALDSFTHNHVNKLINLDKMAVKNVKPNKATTHHKRASDRRRSKPSKPARNGNDLMKNAKRAQQQALFSNKYGRARSTDLYDVKQKTAQK